MTLFGRSTELRAIAAARAQLVTLWGPGGVGKTRLASEHAESERARGREVVWIDLAPARSEVEAASAIASALGVSIDARDDASRALARACATRRALVIADTVEQLDPAARALVASLASGTARVLATSREPLGAEDELAIPIAPLSPEDALAMFDSVARTPCSRETARAIVERLDALPLALELAGARASLLGGPELLSRLDRKLDVMGKLRETIAWSWDLLEERERAALVACASFEAPFDAALAEGAIGEDALDLLERLRTRALLHVGPPDLQGRPTLRLLESVRDFAREHGAVRALHARAVLTRAEPLAEALRRGSDALGELRARQADLASIAEHGDGDDVVRATLALAALLAVTGPAAELVSLATRAMGHDTERLPELRVARAEGHRALGQVAEAAKDLEAALDASGVVLADAMRLLGATERARGRTAAAQAHLEEARAAYRDLGERAREGITVDEIGAVHQTEGRLALARTCHAEAIAILSSAGARRAEGTARSRLAVATHRAGEPASSVLLHEQALAIHRASGHTRLEGAELLHLGFVQHELGAPGAARGAFDEARAVLAAAGARGLEAMSLVLTARLAIDEGEPTAALLALAEAAEITPPSWARAEATRHLVIGHLAMSKGDRASARVAYEASLAASRDVEVGFEALTPAYLALASGDASLFDEARARVARLENPHLAVALEILAGRKGPIDPRATASSSEVRRALAFVGARRGLRIQKDARQVVLPDGREIDLSRRKNVRLVLALIAKERRENPGRAVLSDALLAAGWPGERMRADAGTKRLHTAIWTLRSLGLEGILLTEGDGYLLDPSVPVEIPEL